jgi:hypothetical protein
MITARSSPSTVNQALAAVTLMYEQVGLRIAVNRVRIPRPGAPGALTRHEEAALRRAASRKGPRDSAIIAVLLDAGARAEECVRLDPGTSRSPPAPARSACTARATRSAPSRCLGAPGNWSRPGWTCADATPAPHEPGSADRSPSPASPRSCSPSAPTPASPACAPIAAGTPSPRDSKGAELHLMQHSGKSVSTADLGCSRRDLHSEPAGSASKAAMTCNAITWLHQIRRCCSYFCCIQ